jgi:exodeoxyribonuclease-1
MQSFLWYDYETFGISPKYSRPAQFGGLRTDMNLELIGEPVTIYCSPSDDFLPEPGAVMITGITPQEALEKGVSESMFAKDIFKLFATPGTINVGYNSMRFDNEFTRYLFYRNFYDPYAHEWKNNTSKWDIVDMVRMTRALRPDGITWPIDDTTKKPSNRLELLTVANGIEHGNAHDALADVYATIEIAKLIKNKQPKLWQFLLDNRDKKSVSAMLSQSSPQPLVHSSNKYRSDTLSTAVILPIYQSAFGLFQAWDLRFDPSMLLDLSSEQIIRNLFSKSSDLSDGEERLPIKGINPKHAPALAPISVVNDEAYTRIMLDSQTMIANLEKAKKHITDIEIKMAQVFDPKKSNAKKSTSMHVRNTDDIRPDSMLYDGFIDHQDREIANKVTGLDPDSIAAFSPKFIDERLKRLWILYKARNFKNQLTDGEREVYQKHRLQSILGPESFYPLEKVFGGSKKTSGVRGFF